nr:MAG TPA: hypothetical protein [Caudoviricetes sp.]
MLPSRYSEDFKFFLDPWKWLIDFEFLSKISRSIFQKISRIDYWEQSFSQKGCVGFESSLSR